ncbi:MAG: peptidylprolyl isomerase [Planctomycetales bacterium]|nr:peptidylprolyl isomerase [Planctomycetales bacterium]
MPVTHRFVTLFATAPRALSLCLGAGILALLASAPFAVAQDGKDAPKTDAPSDQPADKPADKPADQVEEQLPADFAGLEARWTKLEAELADVADKYRKAFSSDDKQKIYDGDYRPLVALAQRLLPKLREAAIAEYAKENGKTERVTELLLGFGVEAVRNDDYETALKIGQVLRDGGATNPVVHYILGVAAYSTQQFDMAKEELAKAEEARVLGGRELSLSGEIDELQKLWKEELEIRAKEQAADDLPRVKLETNRGAITIELFENEAPQAVANFISLVKNKFYDGLTFHRVLGNFMAQGGCPEGTGSGGPGYNIYCECQEENHRNHFRGSLSMAHAGRDTGGSQFFLTFRPTSFLNGRHTVFGRVIDGMEVLAAIQRRNPDDRMRPEPDKILRATVIRDRGHEYKPIKVGEKPADAPAPPEPEPSKSPEKAK